MVPKERFLEAGLLKSQAKFSNSSEKTYRQVIGLNGLEVGEDMQAGNRLEWNRGRQEQRLGGIEVNRNGGWREAKKTSSIRELAALEAGRNLRLPGICRGFHEYVRADKNMYRRG